MPWEERDVLSERLRFVHQYESGGFTMSELCRRMGISRPTGYLWWSRYELEGGEGLKTRSRRPKRSPRATPVEVGRQMV